MQSHQNLIDKFIEVDASSRVNQVDLQTNRQCAKLFFQLVQHAIKEGEKGRYHIKYRLLFLAELFIADYYRLIIDPDLERGELNRLLRAIHFSAKQVYKQSLDFNDDFYLKFGILDSHAMFAEKEAFLRIERARELAIQEPTIVISRALESLVTVESPSLAIQDTLARLQEIPQNEKVDQVRIELISALRLQAFSLIMGNFKNLQNRWSKQIYIQCIKKRITSALDAANDHHKRVASHYHDLELKITILTKQIAVVKAIEKRELMAASPNVLASKNLNAAQENLKRLDTDLQKVKGQLEKLVLCLKRKKLSLKCSIISLKRKYLFLLIKLINL